MRPGSAKDGPDKKLIEILRGDFNQLPKPLPNTIKIFLSSTFTDTHEERDYLIEHIYPKLRKYCFEQFGYDFQVVDMRWGITDDSTIKNLTNSICVNEIENCYKNSAGPFFVAFLSHRYGARMLPAKIPKDLFDLIVDELKDEDLSVEVNLENGAQNIENVLFYSYRLDENAESPYLKLLDLNLIVRGYSFDDSNSAVYDKAWSRIQDKLQKNLRKSVDSLFKKNKINRTQRDEYFISVTEMEVLEGVLKRPDADERTLVFIRNISIDSLSNVKLVKRYFELDSANLFDTGVQEMINEMKAKVHSKLKRDRVVTFDVSWNSSFGVTYETNRDYFEQFGQSFFDSLKLLIDSSHSKRKPDAIYNDLSEKEQLLVDEILHHARLTHKNVEKFFGREDLYNSLKEYLMDTENQKPFLVYGESGSGKTTLLSSLVNIMSRSLPKSWVMVVRYLGTSTKSSELKQTLISIHGQLEKIFELGAGLDESADLNSVGMSLENYLIKLTKAKPKRKFFIFLDSIDQLNASMLDLEWLFTIFPAPVKLVCSCLSDFQSLIDKLTQNLELNGSNLLKIEPLRFDSAKTILSTWFKANGRKLTESQWSFIHSTIFKAELQPLYLKLLFDFVKNCESFHELSETLASLTNIEKCISHLFDQMELTHGKWLFSHCVFYLTLFETGIAENELEDILSIDDDVLDEVYVRHQPSIRRFPAALFVRIKTDLNEYLTEKETDGVKVICWYHRKFQSVAWHRYVASLNTSKRDSLITNVIHYFVETWNKNPKPFTYSEYVRAKKGIASINSSALRITKNQSLISNVNSITRFNKRKIRQLPRFIFKLESVEFLQFKFLTLKKHVYFDYEFVYAASCIGDFLFSDNSAELWRFYEKHKNKLGPEDRGTLEALCLIGAIYASNTKQMHDYPESIASQIVARLSSELRLDPNLNELYERFARESHCAFLPLFSYLPISSSDSSDTLFYSDSDIKGLIELKSRSSLIIFTQRLFLLDLDSGKVLEKVNLTEDGASIRNVLISFESAPSQISSFKDLIDCKLVAVFLNRINVYKFNGSLKFTFDFEEAVDKTFLITSRHLVVKQRKHNQIEVFNLSSGKSVAREEFDFGVKEVCCNVGENLAFEMIFEKLNRLFLVVVLETDDVFVLEFDAVGEKLSEVCKIPTPGEQSVKCLVDRGFFSTDLTEPRTTTTNDDDVLVKFCLFYNLDFCVFEVKKERNKFGVFNFRINDYFKFNLSCDLVDYWGENILFMAYSCIYVYNLVKGKLVRVGSDDYDTSPISARLVSPLSLLSFKVRSIQFYKIAAFTESDETSRSLNVSTFDVELFSKEIRPRVNLIFQGKKLFVACSDKTVKKYDLGVRQLPAVSAEKEDLKIDNYSAFSIGDDLVVLKIKDGLVCVMDSKDKSIVYKFDELDEFWIVVDVKRSRNVLIFSLSNKFLFKSSIMIFTVNRKPRIEFLLKYRFDGENNFVDSANMAFYGERVLLQTYNKLNNEIVFSQFKFDEASNELFSLEQKVFNLEETLGVKSLFEENGLMPSSDAICLSHKNNFVLIKNEQGVFFLEPDSLKTLHSLSNEKLNISSKVQPIKHTDDFVGLGAENSSAILIYFEFFKDLQNNFRLRVFKHAKIFLAFKVHSNLISTVEHSFELSDGKISKTETSFNVYDAFKIKETCSFDTRLFQVYLDQNLNDFDYTDDLSHLVMAHVSHIDVYRVGDSMRIARMPVHKLANLVLWTSSQLVVALYATGEFVSFAFNEKLTKSDFAPGQSKEESGTCNLREIVERIKPRWLSYSVDDDCGSDEAQDDHLFNFDNQKNFIQQKNETYFQYLSALQKRILCEPFMKFYTTRLFDDESLNDRVDWLLD